MKKRKFTRDTPVALGKKYYLSGERAVREGDLNMAMAQFALSVAFGCAEGKWALGWYLIYGKSTPHSPKRGFELLFEAAQAEILAAMHSVGVCYSNGYGVKKNKKEAFTWYLRAAELGHPDSQYNVGFFYEKGIAVPQDFAQAKLWYERATDLDKGDAFAALADLYSEGHGVKQDDDTAFVLYRLAARKNVPRAQYNLAIRYIHGWGIRQNLTLGKRWMEKAAKNGHVGAKQFLA